MQRLRGWPGLSYMLVYMLAITVELIVLFAYLIAATSNWMFPAGHRRCLRQPLAGNRVVRSAASTISLAHFPCTCLWSVVDWLAESATTLTANCSIDKILGINRFYSAPLSTSPFFHGLRPRIGSFDHRPPTLASCIWGWLSPSRRRRPKATSFRHAHDLQLLLHIIMLKHLIQVAVRYHFFIPSKSSTLMITMCPSPVSIDLVRPLDSGSSEKSTYSPETILSSYHLLGQRCQAWSRGNQAPLVQNPLRLQPLQWLLGEH